MTYAELQQVIATRLNRFDLLTAQAPSTIPIISSYVQDRILYLQKSLYSPSEQLDMSITTIPYQSTYPFDNYPSLQGVQDIWGVRLLINSTIWYTLTRVDFFSDILDVDVNNPPFVTIPSNWATYGQTLRLYPAPNIAYPLELQCNLSPPAPVNPGDSNFWTTKAQTLVIESVIGEICSTYLNDAERGQRHMAAAEREAQALKRWTQRLRGPGQLRSFI